MAEAVMDQVVCENCGSPHSPDIAECIQCGEPLPGEETPPESPSLLFLVPVALSVSAFSFGLGLVVVGWMAFYITEPGAVEALGRLFRSRAFVLGYAVVWGIAVVMAPYYSPKRRYEFGGMMGNPFSRQDEVDRAHASLGCLAFPFMIVHGLWSQVFERLAADTSDE